MTGGDTTGATVSVATAVAGVAEPFEARMVKVKLPAAVGVPESTPPEERDTPAGSDPEATLQVMGGEPVAVKVVEYATPTWALPRVKGLMTGGTSNAVKFTTAVAEVVDAFDARMVKVVVPAAEGVPESRPPEDSVIPAGSDPDARLHVMGGEPLAVNV